MRKYDAIWALAVAVLLFGGCATTLTTPVQAQSSIPAVSVFGEWKEHWGTPGQTDVTYNDLYRVTQTSGGNVKVQILNRNQKIYGEHLNGTVLTFSQRTDTLVVEYSLTLRQDGRWMVGTATTPKKAVDIKWEKMN